jgi:hypothetical protein
VDDIADRLAARMDALASALRAAGVEPARSARLLESAAAAAVDAVALELLLARPTAPRRVAPPALVRLEPARERPPLPLAA